jgi:hypothetical protein
LKNVNSWENEAIQMGKRIRYSAAGGALGAALVAAFLIWPGTGVPADSTPGGELTAAPVSDDANRTAEKDRNPESVTTAAGESGEASARAAGQHQTDSSGLKPASKDSGAPSPTPAASSTPPASSLDSPLWQEDAELVLYKGPVEHVFFHPLIVYPELAFDGDSMSQGYDDWFTTIPEFKSIIKELYENHYILVDIRTLYEEQAGTDGETSLQLKSLMLPPGKKPLVLSVDDLNYYKYMIKNGNASRLVLDGGGQVTAQSAAPDGSTVISRDHELVPILDDFVSQHPDFSFRGAKGVLAVTGYEGVLGYRTHNPESPGYEAEREGALQVVSRLKETGWSFASHSWGHPDAVKADAERMKKDTERWKREVEPIVGETPVFIYPYGSRLKHSDPKFKLLTDAGFRLFCGVGPAPYLKAGQSAVEMDRRHIDGMALRTQADRLAPLFDAKTILDPRRPAAR